MAAPTGRDPEPINDDENPEWTEADFARAKRGSELLPPGVVAAFGKPRGRPLGSVKPDRKASVTLRLDPDVLEHYRSSGAGWQTRINAALRAGMKAAR